MSELRAKIWMYFLDHGGRIARYEVLEHEIGHRRYRLRLHPSLDGFGLDFILTTHETRLAAT